MAGKTPEGDAQSRRLKLSQVSVESKRLTKAKIVINFTGYIGRGTTRAIKLINAASRSHGGTDFPPYAELFDSKEYPGDLCLLPARKKTDDSVQITWSDKARSVSLDLAEMLVLKEITIPKGTRMEIALYEGKDPDLGPCVGMKVQEAEFAAIKKGTPRKKQAPDKAQGSSLAAQSPSPAQQPQPEPTPKEKQG